MSINYTWKINNIKVKNVSEKKENAVVQTYWQKTGIDENGNEGSFTGATPFTVDPTDDSGPFTPFELLTEEEIISWIKTVVVGVYEDHVNEQIQKQINNKISPITEAILPWAGEINHGAIPVSA